MTAADNDKLTPEQIAHWRIWNLPGWRSEPRREAGK